MASGSEEPSVTLQCSSRNERDEVLALLHRLVDSVKARGEEGSPSGGVFAPHDLEVATLTALLTVGTNEAKGVRAGRFLQRGKVRVHVCVCGCVCRQRGR